MRTSAAHLRRWIGLGGLLLCGLVACGKSTSKDHDHPHEEAAAPTNRIDVNSTVRQNLGMTFAKVESRRVAGTLRLPGVFEISADGKRAYGARMGGTLEVAVSRYQTVVPGTPLYAIDGAAWRTLKAELVENESRIAAATADITATDAMIAAEAARMTEVRNGIDVLAARVTTLEALRAAGGVKEDELATAKTNLVEMRIKAAESAARHAELSAKRTEATNRLAAGTSRMAILFEAASALSGMSSTELTAVSKESPTPVWKTLARLEVKAVDGGVVESIDAMTGSVIDEGATVLTVVKPERMRFRATVLQGDFAKIAGATTGVLVPGFDTGHESAGRLPCDLLVAPVAATTPRAFDLSCVPNRTASVPSWARLGAHAFLEVEAKGADAEPALAVPLRCIVRDGTTAILFRRDPADPDKAIRVEADLGPSDGRWVVIQSGLAEGNEVVADGVYQLLVATSGSITKGGHFHPDGTFHEGDK